MNNIITLTRAVLTLAFLYFGLRKLAGYHVDIAIYDAIGFGQAPRYITGSVEVIGALLLWKKGLEGLAAVLLATTVIIGLCALLLWVGPPYWHMCVLIGGSACVAWVYRTQVARLIKRTLGHMP